MNPEQLLKVKSIFLLTVTLYTQIKVLRRMRLKNYFKKVILILISVRVFQEQLSENYFAILWKPPDL